MVLISWLNFSLLIFTIQTFQGSLHTTPKVHPTDFFSTFQLKCLLSRPITLLISNYHSLSYPFIGLLTALQSMISIKIYWESKLNHKHTKKALIVLGIFQRFYCFWVYLLIESNYLADTIGSTVTNIFFSYA